MTTRLELNPLLEPIRPQMEQMEALLQGQLAGLEEPLRTMVGHVLASGKRLRLALIILTGELFARPSAPFQQLGVAVEMLHTATLIHDDIVDQSPLRRGSQTLHTIWPLREAVLVGDHLHAQAAALVAELNRPAILNVFAKTLCTICAGEIRQTFVNEGRLRNRDEYTRSIEAKTASLVIGAVEMAGLLAEASKTQLAALRNFGREFGLAFQIADDVLDFIGTEAQLGKPPGSDLQQGLMTLPTLCYLEQTENDTAVSAVLSGKRDDEHIQSAIEAVRTSGAIDAALAQGRAHAQRSQRALEALPDNHARQILHALADYVVTRNR